MTNPLRLAAAGAVLALAASAGTSGAVADTTGMSCDDTATMQSAIADAEQALSDARAAYHAANRPLGRLVADKRHEARDELASSRAAVKELRSQVRHASSSEEARAAGKELRIEQRDVAHARSLLEFKRVALAEIKADRTSAKAAVRAARAQLQELRAFAGSCSGTDDESTDDGTDDGTDDAGTGVV